MQPLIAELDALVAKTDSKNASMTLPKILECVCNLINYLSTANKVYYLPINYSYLSSSLK